jgi:hypothetical protein
MIKKLSTKAFFMLISCIIFDMHADADLYDYTFKNGTGEKIKVSAYTEGKCGPYHFDLEEGKSHTIYPICCITKIDVGVPGKLKHMAWKRESFMFERGECRYLRLMFYIKKTKKGFSADYTPIYHQKK